MSDFNLNEVIINAQKGNKECLGQLINYYDGYIKKFIKLFNLTAVQEEEVYNSAIIGLMTALDNFNVSRGLKLNTYATGFIKKEIVEFIKKELLPSNFKIFDEKANKEITFMSLDAEIDMDNSSIPMLVKNTVGIEDSVEDKIFIDELLSPFAEKEWIKDIYFNGSTVKQIAEEKKVSKSFIYRKKREIFDYIRKEVAVNDYAILN
ncbi:TPA: sigma-70 family RNA polymerase sigma factor [Clostridium perfringens]|uniref:Sigma-70 family RNA polymerase sigma factor n=1 Tax=Clostridium perfringens TaxID=1502 RepID=A0A8H9R0I2_CLOPF|nr:sigma-70 family RNA polymerase sigma factor [Clostridium perfringens]